MSKILARKSGNSTAELYIYDQIGACFFSEGITAKDTKDKLKEIGAVDSINVRINSIGGDVHEGVAIYNLLRSSGAQIIVDIDGAAISIASIIAMAGDEIRIAGNAMLMIHDPWSGGMGTADDLRKVADKLDKAKTTLSTTYSKRRGIDIDAVERMMSEETWFTAAEALSEGFVDSVTEDAEVLVNLDPHRFSNTPRWAVNRQRAGGSRSMYAARLMSI